jgi:hypothetical protein
MKQRDWIRGYDVFDLAQTHYERRTLPKRDNPVWLVPAHSNNRVLTSQSWKNLLHPFLKKTVLTTKELSNQLGIGVRLQIDAVGYELRSQIRIILENAVVHDSDFFCFVELRMSVIFSRGAVRRPPSMPHAYGAVQGFMVRTLLEVSQLACGSKNLDSTSTQHSQPSRVVTAVL